MNKASLLELLAQVQSGTLTPAAATERLASLPYEDLGHARIDHHRSIRTGLPEVIYAQNKSPQQTADIFAHMAASGIDWPNETVAVLMNPLQSGQSGE